MSVLLRPAIPGPGATRLHWPALPAGARALALAEAVQSDTRPWIHVASDIRELEKLAVELRFFGGAELEILTLPDWETLPYDQFSPPPDIVSERLRTLARLGEFRHGILLLTADSLLTRLPPVSYVSARSFSLERGAALAIESLRRRLSAAGYASVSQVSGPGEFALRGSLFDVWPMGSEFPVRIDLLEEQIDSLRRFDPETQRSLEAIDALRLLPAREIPLDADSVREYRRRFRLRFAGDVARLDLYRGVSEGIAPPGIEYYLPLFFPATASLMDYLPADLVLATEPGLEAALSASWQAISARYEQYRHDIERPLLAPEEVFVSPAELGAQLAVHSQVYIEDSGGGSADSADQGCLAPPDFRLDARATEPLAPLLAFLEQYPGRVLLAADSPGRREVITQMLIAHGRSPRSVNGWQQFVDGDARLAIIVAGDLRGVALRAPALMLLAETQLFGTRARQERRRRRSLADPAAILRNLQSLEPGAPVVHETYGVGRYLGLELMQIGGETGEFLLLEYQDGDRVYVPVHALHLVNRYAGGSPESAPLHKLGTEQWAKARRRAAEAVRDVAAELLDLHARRHAHEAAVLRATDLEYQAFANAFPFEETADQADAIAQVIADLARPTPMDRIICGDVGFGKTEVAMRAAFVAVQAGHQVTVLVPTTLLAEQHLQSFRDRFADWPVRVEALSRFRSGRDARAVLEGFESGKIDILIATHKLLHTDVRAQHLGLLIIDEEHRFGVRDKERLKTLRAEVHVLTLTATPIPRTLNMALGGLRELSRGGQIYLVHNEVQSIEKVTADFATLVPEAQVRFGHGQMRERELEQLMVDFYHRRFNVLVCTTIIESGIDVPTANTILINRADRLGLAQLHQLRGRVGRSHHRAYAYLIIPSRRALSSDAAKRLDAIESMEDLGAGFLLATHDLEIRGAGEFLGEQQSGELTEVGLTLYLDMLEQAVVAFRAGHEPQLERPLASVSEVDLHVPAFLPEDFVPDVHLRLALYQRIAAATALELQDMGGELLDRFGPLPPPASHLLQLATLRLGARALGLRRLDLGPQGGSVQFEAANRVDAATVIALIQRPAHDYRMDGPLKLRFTRGLSAIPARFAFAHQLLQELAGPAAAPKAANIGPCVLRA